MCKLDKIDTKSRLATWHLTPIKMGVVDTFLNMGRRLVQS